MAAVAAHTSTAPAAMSFTCPATGCLLGRHQVDQLLNGGIEQFGCYHHSDAENDYHPLHAGNA